MIIYDYVAANDPWGSKSLLHSYGFPTGPDIDDGDNLAQALNDLHAEFGQEVMEKLIEMHPDYKLIVEAVSAKDIVSREKKSGGCGCGGGCKHKGQAAVASKLAEQSQTSASNNGWQLHQGNLFLIAATLILAVAIIVTNKNNS